MVLHRTLLRASGQNMCANQLSACRCNQLMKKRLMLRQSSGDFNPSLVGPVVSGLCEGEHDVWQHVVEQDWKRKRAGLHSLLLGHTSFGKTSR